MQLLVLGADAGVTDFHGLLSYKVTAAKIRGRSFVRPVNKTCSSAIYPAFLLEPGVAWKRSFAETPRPPQTRVAPNRFRDGFYRCCMSLLCSPQMARGGITSGNTLPGAQKLAVEVDAGCGASRHGLAHRPQEGGGITRRGDARDTGFLEAVDMQITRLGVGAAEVLGQ